MKTFIGSGCVITVFICCLTSCAGYNAKQTAKTSIVLAQKEIPEDVLLDASIVVFKSSEITNKKAKKEGTNPDVRNAESHFIPYHLKNTFQQSSHWGMVRFMPVKSESTEVLVEGEIIESNGENLVVRVTVSDSAGTVWFEKKYRATVNKDYYKDTTFGQKDVFQGLYNAIANDTVMYMRNLSPEEIKNIRTISKLKFAQSFSPDAFNNYLKQDQKGKLALNRLPADNDTMMERVLRIREREHMFLDTLNEYYENFYNEMWPSYEEWRKMNLTERVVLSEQKKSAFTRIAGGVMLVALAIGLEVADVDSTALTAILVTAGGQVFVSGINISKQAQMHYEALRELGESFGSEMEPIAVELEGKQYELTGSAEEQYARLRELLRKIYYTEIDFVSPEDSAKEKM